MIGDVTYFFQKMMSQTLKNLFLKNAADNFDLIILHRILHLKKNTIYSRVYGTFKKYIPYTKKKS